MSDRGDRLRDLFLAARALAGDELGAYLDSACGEDLELRAEVESLLESSQRSDLDSADVELAVVSEASRTVTDFDIPESIGAYRIVRRLGTGGMGSVFEAEQANPRRTVALKIINTPWLTPGMVRRFETEVQALGNLQHRGIAQIFEAGSFEMDGGTLPYFAMEYIGGRTLTHYAEQEKLSVPDRLDLIARICDAVDHAHRQSIIHRDLKPGNILVSERGHPKVLDFGVARVTQADVRAATVHTAVGQLVGTLPYMSPEQVSGEVDELDLRTDVYSLGVIAYELLTGKFPYDLGHGSIPDAIVAIRDEEPEPLDQHGRELGGDVKTIVHRALEKEPDRRYQSAAELAADIRRFLRHEPILARPQSTWYRAQKFARRNQALVTGGAVFLVVVLASLGIMAQLYLRSESERVAKEREATRATAVSSFLLDDMLAAARTIEGGFDTKVVDVLDRAAEKAGTRFAEQPLLEAEVRLVLGETYRDLGKYAEAREQGRLSGVLFAEQLGRGHQRTIMSNIIEATAANFMDEPEQAEALARDALARARPALGPTSLTTAAAASRLGEILQKQKKHEEAEELLRMAIEIFDDDASSPNDQIEPRLSLAASLHVRGQVKEATVILRETLALSERHSGSEHPATLSTKNNLIGALLAIDEDEEAADLAVSLAADFSKVYPPEHPLNMFVNVTCARALQAAMRLDEAMAYATRAYEVSMKSFGPSRYETERAANACEEIARDAADAPARLHWAYVGLGCRLRIASPGELASVVARMRMPQSLPDYDAEEFAEQVTTMEKESVPPGHARRSRYLCNLGRGYLEFGQQDDALWCLREAYAALGESDTSDLEMPAIALALAEIHTSRGEEAEAARWRKLAAAE